MKWNELFINFIEDNFDLSLNKQNDLKNVKISTNKIELVMEEDEILIESEIAWKKLIEMLNKLKQRKK